MIVGLLTVIGVIMWTGYALGLNHSSAPERVMGWYICNGDRYNGIYESEWNEPVMQQTMKAVYVNCTSESGYEYTLPLVLKVNKLNQIPVAN